VSTARNEASSRRRRRLGPSPAARGLRAAILAPLLAAGIGAGFATAQPADAAVSAPRFLSAVVPCKSAADPSILRSVTPAHLSTPHDASSPVAGPCWKRSAGFQES